MVFLYPLGARAGPRVVWDTNRDKAKLSGFSASAAIKNGCNLPSLPGWPSSDGIVIFVACPVYAFALILPQCLTSIRPFIYRSTEARERHGHGTRRTRPVPRLVAAVAQVGWRFPWLVLTGTALSCVLCLWYTYANLTYENQRNDLHGKEKAYFQRWEQYVKEFGDDDDMVVVVQGKDRGQMIAAMEDLASQIEQKPRPVRSPVLQGRSPFASQPCPPFSSSRANSPDPGQSLGHELAPRGRRCWAASIRSSAGSRSI